MNVKWWFNIADSTVYSTLKSLEKKAYITGATEKVGNMPDRTVYSLSDKGKCEFQDTLRKSILQFDYDTNIFGVSQISMLSELYQKTKKVQFISILAIFFRNKKCQKCHNDEKVLDKLQQAVPTAPSYSWSIPVPPSQTSALAITSCSDFCPCGTGRLPS